MQKNRAWSTFYSLLPTTVLYKIEDQVWLSDCNIWTTSAKPWAILGRCEGMYLPFNLTGGWLYPWIMHSIARLNAMRWVTESASDRNHLRIGSPSMDRDHQRVACNILRILSASGDDNSTVDCLFEHQLTGHPFIMNIKPEVVFRLSLSPVQSQSKYPSTRSSSLPPYVIPRSNEPLYLSESSCNTFANGYS